MQRAVRTLPNLIFLSRWLQAPLYLGLIVVLGVYVYQFGLVLVHLVGMANKTDETAMMLMALELVDIVLLANLLIMVIMGGYETFVSNLNLKHHPDQPDWLDSVNAGTLKIKLALSLVTISSIHLLSTFIDPAQKDFYVVLWQVVIHMTLIVSALAIAFTDRIMMKTHHH